MEFTSTIKQNYEFRRLYSKGKSCANAYLVVYCRKNRAGRSRIGYTVSNKVGHAVVRNRIRRRLRAAAALALAEHAGTPCDLVVVARPETVQADFTALVADLSVAFDRARPAGGGKRRSAPRKAS